ncbi:uncharacterized protein LOC105191406 isoform X1 [Harpegnathos saltator]|uniref:uncharacterized protein LOC105191406 isoform X1 n=1 Tax=Harpegnathos saltator TaxID=610380 RepID=UPI000590A027|nr:uncharacterized protein LOC105191406 isoform X1 [Harpegnathos saltator]
MAEEYLIWDLLNIENRVRQVRRREEKRAWRDINDSFELHNDVFTNLFRLLSDTVLELLDTLRPRLRRLRPWDFTRTTANLTNTQVCNGFKVYAKASRTIQSLNDKSSDLNMLPRV